MPDYEGSPGWTGEWTPGRASITFGLFSSRSCLPAQSNTPTESSSHDPRRSGLVHALTPSRFVPSGKYWLPLRPRFPLRLNRGCIGPSSTPTNESMSTRCWRPASPALFLRQQTPDQQAFSAARAATKCAARAEPSNAPKRSLRRRGALRTHNLEFLKPAAFVLRNIDITLGIHGGANGIKELAREEKPSAAADR
jgi:hypothetical protein